MPTFKNLNDMFKYIEKNVKTTLPNVGKVVEDTLKDYIMKHLYQANASSEYFRTYDYVNSIRVGKVQQSGDGYSVEIYFDSDSIRSNKVDDSKWNQHMSFDGSTEYDGRSIGDWLVEWIEYGENSPAYSREGIYATSNTVQELENTRKHLSKIMQLLKNRGINAELVKK